MKPLIYGYQSGADHSIESMKAAFYRLSGDKQLVIYILWLTMFNSSHGVTPAFISDLELVVYNRYYFEFMLNNSTDTTSFSEWLTIQLCVYL